jgi:diguanylate cyclase (GGDEF)-like protein
VQKIAILYDASQAVLSTFDLDEVLRRILATARDYFHLTNVAIFLMDKDKQEMYPKALAGWNAVQCTTRIRIGQGLIGAAAAERRPIYAPDVLKDSRYLPSGDETRSELAIPLMVREEVVGVLDCQSGNIDHFNNETIDLLTLFSTQASMALQNAQLYSLERRRAKQLEVINEIARQTTAVLDQAELLEKVCSLIQQSFMIGQVSILLREEDELVLRASRGGLTINTPVGGKLPITSELCGRSLAAGLTIIESRVEGGSSLSRETRSCMGIPLVSFGQTLGMLVMESVEEGRFQASDGESLEAVADICATAIQNAHYVERVKQLAYLDGLTGIFNRRFFELRILEEIDRARRFQTGMAVLMVDIDQFKRLNDEFGHLLGDEVLRQVSSIFSQQLRKIDVVCRYGGEEFAIVLSQTNPQHALAVAEKLRRLVENWQFPGVARPVTISTGVATFPNHGTTRDELVKAADAGLYAAKQGGRNRVLLGPTIYKVSAQAGSVEASTN